MSVPSGPAAFVPGQRWVSATEADLGLGIIESNADRRVVVVFPASGERRTYAADNAPLSRVEYAVGEQVATEDGMSLGIVGKRESEGLLVYTGVLEDGREIDVEEIDLDSAVHFSRPQDRLFAGQIDRPDAFTLRAEAHGHRHRHRASAAFGLLGPRVELLPHQLFIAAEVGERHAPRVLLADEVGLGKTIEAGLVVHQQLARGHAARVLVLVPESLLYQWLVEMLRRFNLHFAIIDADRIAGAEGNPFEEAQLCLAPLEPSAAPAVAESMLAAGWDIVVVDEAHRLAPAPGEAGAGYRLVEALAATVPGLLLLTATPEQLGVEGHFARLRLLDPTRFADPERFAAEESGYRAIGALADAVEAAADGEPSATLLDGVTETLGSARATRLGEALARGDADEEAALVVRDLIDRHGTGRVLFRNTRRAVGGFPERRLHGHPIEGPADWAPRREDEGLTAVLQPERRLGEDWLRADPRVDWVLRWLVEHRTDKALLVCAQGSTALALERHLRVRHGVRACVFHEEMDLVARDRAAAYFAGREDGAQLLVCSEIGSEGRNFQQAHHLILFDLPTSADLLEQRIGRLDRIGQRHPVDIHVPYYDGTAQHALLRWFHEGLDAFEQPFPAPARMERALGEARDAVLSGPCEATAMDALVARARALRETLVEELEAGRDRLLERSSFDAERADAVIDALVEAGRRDALAECLERALDLLGVEVEAQDATRLVVRPGDHMIESGIPGLAEEGMSVTYDRAYALAHEDCHFLTWEHPLVRGALELLLDGPLGNASLGTLELDALTSGTMLVETVFAVHCPAPRRLRVDRYLAGASVRLVMDDAGRDFAGVLTTRRLAGRVRGVPAASGLEVIKHARAAIAAQIALAERAAEPRRDAMIEEALRQAKAALGAEQERLTALARVNPSVREDEVTALETLRAELESHLENASLGLDAVRVLVVV